MIEQHSTEPFAIEVPTQAIRIDCYVRPKQSPALLKQTESVCNRLERLDAAGILEDFEVKQWPPAQQLPGETESAGTTRSAIIEDFEDWARENGFSLQPAFERTTVSPSPFGFDQAREHIRVPQIALALSEPATDELYGVLPCREEPGETQSQVYTVTQWLDALEAFLDSMPEWNSEESLQSVH